jgi:hypothetical protein
MPRLSNWCAAQVPVAVEFSPVTCNNGFCFVAFHYPVGTGFSTTMKFSVLACCRERTASSYRRSSSGGFDSHIGEFIQNSD